MTNHNPHRAGKRLTALTAAVVVVWVLSACSGGSAAVPSDSNPAFSATGSLSPEMAPLSSVPQDFRVFQGEGFTISAAAAFQEQRTTSSNGQSALALRRTSSVPELPSGVVVLRDVNPEQDVVEQMYALEVAKRTLGATEVIRSDVIWPGARRAVVVQWTEAAPAGGGSAVAARYVQLGAQVDDSLIFSVVAVSPAGDVRSSQVVDVLRTFRPAGGGV